MAAFSYSFALIVGSWLLFALSSPADALTCSSKKFEHGAVYSHCADLPHLSAFLHWTYDMSNSSLSIAYIAPPAKSDGWVAWAINPTRTGMAGSQALIASKSDGSVIVRTFNISSYGSIVPGKLSFDVWDLSAEHSDGKYTIFAKVKVPAMATSVNQVWQSGPGVNETTGWLIRHDFLPANLNSFGVLKLSGHSSPTPAPAPAPSSPSPVSGSPQGSSPSNGSDRSSGINRGLRMCVYLLLAAVFLFSDLS